MNNFHIPKNLMNNSSINKNSNIFIDFKSKNLCNNNNNSQYNYNNNLSYSNDMFQKYDNLNSDNQYKSIHFKTKF